MSTPVAALLLLLAASPAAAAHTLDPPTPLPVGALLRPEMIPLGSAASPVPGKRCVVVLCVPGGPRELRADKNLACSLSLAATPHHRPPPPPTPHNTPRSYALTGMKPHVAYQIRVSHPSTIPATVGILVGEEEEEGAEVAHAAPATVHHQRTAMGGRRSLLDTTRAHVTGRAAVPRTTITITVNATTKGFYAPGFGPPPHLPVAITAQPLRVLGLMPADCGPVLAAVAALAVGIAAVVPWWADEGVRLVGGWLDGEEGVEGGEKAR